MASVFKVAKDLADRTLALPSSYKPAVMGGERDPSLFLSLRSWNLKRSKSTRKNNSTSFPNEYIPLQSGSSECLTLGTHE